MAQVLQFARVILPIAFKLARKSAVQPFRSIRFEYAVSDGSAAPASRDYTQCIRQNINGHCGFNYSASSAVVEACSPVRRKSAKSSDTLTNRGLRPVMLTNA